MIERSLDRPIREAVQAIQNHSFAATWRGVPAIKHPCDFWTYQEIIHDTQPDFIVEIGNWCGGTLLALADLCDMMGRGTVIGVDQDHSRIYGDVRLHDRIHLIQAPAVYAITQVASIVNGAPTLVIEDSSHQFNDTLDILRTYEPLILPDQYMIVEDGILGRGVETKVDRGPYEACAAFLSEHSEFEADRLRELWLLTANPGGFLRRIR